jgi:hypothetical protein
MNADAAPIRLTFSLFSVIVLFAQRSVRRFKLQTIYDALIAWLITKQLQKGKPRKEKSHQIIIRRWIAAVGREKGNDDGPARDDPRRPNTQHRCWDKCKWSPSPTRQTLDIAAVQAMTILRRLSCAGFSGVALQIATQTAKRCTRTKNRTYKCQ